MAGRRFGSFIHIGNRMRPVAIIRLDPRRNNVIRRGMIRRKTRIGGKSIVVHLSGSGLSLRVLSTRTRLTRGRGFLHGARIAVRRSGLGGRLRGTRLSISVAHCHHTCGRRGGLCRRGLVTGRRFLGTGRSFRLTDGGCSLIIRHLHRSSVSHAVRVSRVRADLSGVHGGVTLIRRHGRRLGIHSRVSNRLKLLSIILNRGISTKRGVKRVGSLSSCGVRTLVSRRCVSHIGGKLSTAFRHRKSSFRLGMHGICPRIQSNGFHASFIFANRHPSGVHDKRACCVGLRLKRPARDVVVPHKAFFRDAKND